MMGLAYAMGSQRFRPWGSWMDLALCTGDRVGVTCCHFFFSCSTEKEKYVSSIGLLFSLNGRVGDLTVFLMTLMKMNRKEVRI